MLTYREILAILAKLEAKYQNAKANESSTHHEKKFAHQAVFVLAQVDREIREGLKSKLEKEKDNGQNKKSFW